MDTPGQPSTSIMTRSAALREAEVRSDAQRRGERRTVLIKTLAIVAVVIFIALVAALVLLIGGDAV